MTRQLTGRFAYYVCAECQVAGWGPELDPHQVACWCCGHLVPSWTRGARPVPADS